MEGLEPVDCGFDQADAIWRTGHIPRDRGIETLKGFPYPAGSRLCRELPQLPRTESDSSCLFVPPVRPRPVAKHNPSTFVEIDVTRLVAKESLEESVDG